MCMYTCSFLVFALIFSSMSLLVLYVCIKCCIFALFCFAALVVIHTSSLTLSLSLSSTSFSCFLCVFRVTICTHFLLTWLLFSFSSLCLALLSVIRTYLPLSLSCPFVPSLSLLFLSLFSMCAMPGEDTRCRQHDLCPQMWDSCMACVCDKTIRDACYDSKSGCAHYSLISNVFGYNNGTTLLNNDWLPIMRYSTSISTC